MGLLSLLRRGRSDVASFRAARDRRGRQLPLAVTTGLAVLALAVGLARPVAAADLAAETDLPVPMETQNGAAADGGDAAAAESAVDVEALAALDAMGGYLRSLKTFAVRSDFTTEDVLDTGEKIDSAGTVAYLVRQPDRLRATVTTDDSERIFYYDGTSLTMYGPKIGYYASVPAPGTIAEMLTMADARFGIELPLADLFLWGTKDDGRADLTSGYKVGTVTIGGRSCDQYAFRQPGADWQLWIATGDAPLPCKLAIVATDDERLPEYTSVLGWTLDAPVADADFVFVPPADARKIGVEEIDQDPAAGDADPGTQP